MIPMPIITFIFSNIISALFKFLQARSEAKDRQHERLISIAVATEKSQTSRNKNKNRSFQWTKRYLAVTAWTVYWGAKVAILFGVAATGIVYGEPSTIEHGFWIFGWTETIFKFYEVPGVPFTSFDYHMLSAISGSYFGASIMETNR